jgi:hypothetical protein
MSFPIVRPVDIARMPPKGRERLRQRLVEECAAATARHEAILQARRLPVPEPTWLTSARLTELERCEAESRGAVPESVGAAPRDARGRFLRRESSAALLERGWLNVPDRRAS